MESYYFRCCNTPLGNFKDEFYTKNNNVKEIKIFPFYRKDIVPNPIANFCKIYKSSKGFNTPAINALIIASCFEAMSLYGDKIDDTYFNDITLSGFIFEPSTGYVIPCFDT